MYTIWVFKIAVVLTRSFMAIRIISSGNHPACRLWHVLPGAGVGIWYGTYAYTIHSVEISVGAPSPLPSFTLLAPFLYDPPRMWPWILPTCGVTEPAVTPRLWSHGGFAPLAPRLLPGMRSISCEKKRRAKAFTSYMI